MTFATIVIVAYRSAAVLPACFAALEAQTDRDFQLVIVDNSLDEACPQPPESLGARIVRPGMNTGFARGTNLGAYYAESRWLITLNPDARPMPDWMASLKAGAERHPGAHMLSSTLVGPSGRLDGAGDGYSVFGVAWRMLQGAPTETLERGDYRVLAPCGAAAAIRLDVFRALDGFDESFFCYLEDVDLGLRVHASGGACWHIPGARVAHLGGASSNASDAFIREQIAVNELRLLRRVPRPLRWGMGALHAALVLWRAAREPCARSALRWKSDAIRHGTIGSTQPATPMSLSTALATIAFSPKILAGKRLHQVGSSTAETASGRAC